MTIHSVTVRSYGGAEQGGLTTYSSSYSCYTVLQAFTANFPQEKSMGKLVGGRKWWLHDVSLNNYGGIALQPQEEVLGGWPS